MLPASTAPIDGSRRCCAIRAFDCARASTPALWSCSTTSAYCTAARPSLPHVTRGTCAVVIFHATAFTARPPCCGANWPGPLHDTRRGHTVALHITGYAGLLRGACLDGRAR